MELYAKDEDGQTPLHMCLNAELLFLVRQVLALLVRRGAELNVADEDGQTPLHYAALCEQVRVKFVSALS